MSVISKLYLSAAFHLWSRSLRIGFSKYAAFFWGRPASDLVIGTLTAVSFGTNFYIDQRKKIQG